MPQHRAAAFVAAIAAYHWCLSAFVVLFVLSHRFSCLQSGSCFSAVEIGHLFLQALLASVADSVVGALSSQIDAGLVAMDAKKFKMGLSIEIPETVNGRQCLQKSSIPYVNQLQYSQKNLKNNKTNYSN